MSTASINPTLINTAPYEPYIIMPLTDTSESRTPVGYRLAEIKWRFTEVEKAKGGVKRSPVCVPVPFIKLDVEPSCLMEVVQESIENAQDSMIAAFINNTIKDNTNWNMIGKSIPTEISTPDGLAALMAEERSRGRLSKESIVSYFDNFLLEPLLKSLVERNPSMEDTLLTTHANRYKDALAALASPRSMLPIKSAVVLNKIVDMGSDGKVKRALSEKLNGFINPKKDEELADLL